MQYPAPAYNVVVPVAKSNTTKIVLAIVCIIVLGILILGAIGIALGVGLGVGLSRNNGGSSNSGSSATSATTAYSILAAPTVTCTYGGSSTCGCAATQPSFATARIYQGYAATSNSWPWIVAVYSNNGNTFCGGFLVTYQHVVTAAHCVNGQSASAITVYAGIQQLSQRSSGQSRSVLTVTVNSGYSSSTITNDIAVLTLQSAFTQTSTVGQCCLTSDTSLPNVGDLGVIAGWGEIKGSTTVSDTLQQAVIQVQTFSSCPSGVTSSTQFCAGYDGTNACNGDSGSPFMISLNNSWTCAGIVSNSVTCGDNTVYTRVSAFRSFINGTISG
jgi:secreted trypsin-like serine protease